MERKFILAITDHRIVGPILVSYTVEKQDKSDYYQLIERIAGDDVRKRPTEFTDEQKKIVKITEEYGDTELVRLFSKKKITSQEFLSGLTPDLLNNHIRPFIERRLLKIFELLKQTPIDIYFKDSPKQIYLSDKVSFSNEPAEAVFNFIRTDEEFKYFLSINHNQKEMKLTGEPGVILVNEPCHLILRNQLLAFSDIDGKKLTPFFKNEFVKVPKIKEEEYLEKFVSGAIKKFKVNCTGFSIKEETSEPQVILSLEGDLAYFPVLKTSFDYGKNKIFNAGEKNVVQVALNKEAEGYVFYKTFRNKNTENDAIEFLLSLGLHNDGTAYFRIRSESTDTATDLLYDTIYWLNSHTADLQKKGIIIQQNFFDKKYYHKAIDLHVSFDKKDDWFDVYTVVKLEDYEIPFIRLKKYIIEEIREFPLPDGRIVILPKEWFAKYSDLFCFGKTNGDHILLNKQHLSVLENTPISLQQNYQDALLELSEKSSAWQKPDLPAVLATLRPYQEEGFNWMYWLYTNNLGACLADDMGLGKTLQTLVLLKKVIQSIASTENSVPASLIVLPASLVHNWYNEIQKFTPEIKVLKYVGANRNVKISDFDNYNIILTTYGVVRNEYDQLLFYRFLYLILDESQTIKNSDSKIFQAVTELKSRYRLVLTGTPIENSLTDLWSQMEFINPGLLGELNFFRQYFVLPIEKEGDEKKRERLKRLIQPFILRRKKQEVAADLPSLTEQILLCSMSENQKSYYEEEKSKIRNEVLQSIDQNGIEKSTITVLNALIKLRQIANHPVLVDNTYTYDSGKFEEVIECLENMYLENHKVLIFSSFVKHLELVRKYFEEKNLTYSILTGETRNREEVVRNFQENEDNRFFLISLKAGGVGLNLTAADYVFILDPWWNPAAEMQAINRAHRIGQTENVFVYRFITAETVEEKIIKLQERKSELAEIFINSNNPFTLLTKENILELFT